MRSYELTFITHPELDTEALNEIVTKVQGWVTEAEGTVSQVDIWGKRQLAYPIRKQKDGQYVFITFEAAPKFSVVLEHNLRFVEAIMRFMIIVKDE